MFRIKKLLIIAITVLLISCNTDKTKGKFTVYGEIKNIPNQKIFLEEIYFDQKPPLVLDTMQIVNGKFKFNEIAQEQGLYRLRLEKSYAYFFINDKSDIPFSADAKEQSLQSQEFKTSANVSLKKFMIILDSLQSGILTQNNNLEQLLQTKPPDSILHIAQDKFNQLNEQYKSFLISYIDTTTSPVIALFALGYTEHVEAAVLNKTITDLAKRYPGHQMLGTMIARYQAQQKQTTSSASLEVGSIAPEISLPDVNGTTFLLSSLKGKYVLVDFWASWCGPCRGENPNVVQAYNKFKGKNFTILGVSLDKDKSAWQTAIKDDGLAWQHVSDLQFWNSAVVPLYNIESIPFNVLLNPEGKIIAKALRGQELETKLAEVLK